MKKDPKGTVEFNGIMYELTRSDLQMIVDALDIVNPDGETASKQAAVLLLKFRLLASN
jgi:hypothetical protein